MAYSRNPASPDKTFSLVNRASRLMGTVSKKNPGVLMKLWSAESGRKMINAFGDMRVLGNFSMRIT